jgi:hypothetical protein
MMTAGPMMNCFCTGATMNRTASILACTLTLLSFAALWAPAGEAGDAKAPAWKHFLPRQEYEELTKRSLARLGALAKDEKSEISDVRAEALILAGYAMSTKTAPLASLPQPAQAVKIADLGARKDGAEAARKLAVKLASGKTDEKDAAEIKSWRGAIGDVKDIMYPLATHAKKGEGIHADLKYNDKMKNQNGIEALINALATKKMTDANLGKMSKELELLGYRVATIGALTLQRGPAEKKKGIEDRVWDDQAVMMRDAAIELAEGARKKDGPAILEASKRLENSCVECHAYFK